MSGNRWDQPGVPHEGWHCVDVVDLRADGESADETDYATCQMCGNEKIRYVHIMEHPDQDQNFDVGCVCAEKMIGDHEGPKRREATLKNFGGQPAGPAGCSRRPSRPKVREWLRNQSDCFADRSSCGGCPRNAARLAPAETVGGEWRHGGPPGSAAAVVRHAPARG